MPETRETEFFACLALRNTPGVGPKTLSRLLAHYPSAYDAVRDAANWPGLKLASARQAKACATQAWRMEAEDEFHRVRRRGMAYLLRSDPQFPDHLRLLDDPPLVLYYQGDVELLKNPGVAVVGARRCNGRGDVMARDISADLSRIGLTIVSGMALGVDRQAHLGGLAHIGSSIAVLGCGLDVLYPRANADLWEAMADRGLIVTEFGPATRPESKNFPHRNRLISGLSLGVLVAQAAKRSGSLITARLALEQGKEVFALPGGFEDPDFEGCNQLIKTGASLVQSAEDIVWVLKDRLRERLGKYPDPAALLREARENDPPDQPEPEPAPRPETPPRPAAPPPELSESEAGIVQALSAERRHIDEIVREVGRDSATVSAILLDLEMRGLVRLWPGMYYALVEDSGA
jgi:DNA processing protein